MSAAPAAAPAGRRHGVYHPVFHPLTVAAVERLTDDAVAVTFAVPPRLRADYAFTPGQHVTLRATVDGVQLRRTYSICATPGSGRLRIAVKRIAGGVFSDHVTTRLAVGDVVEVMTPTGGFGSVLASSARGSGAAAGPRSYAAVAAGSGITPVLSVLATALETDPTCRVALVYGNRTSAEVMFLDELADLKDRYTARFRLLHVLSREPQDVEVLSGRLDGDRLERILATVLPPDTVDEWFLCGPLGLVEQARAVLLGRGVPPRHVHTELFHVDGEAPREPAEPGTAPRDPGETSASAVTVVLDGRATTVSVPRAGQRILDAVLAVRADAPYACKGGVCGTCRARVVAGEVAMARNYALEQDELDAGMVLACQSHPVTDSVVLDFDG